MNYYNLPKDIFNLIQEFVVDWKSEFNKVIRYMNKCNKIIINQSYLQNVGINHVLFIKQNYLSTNYYIFNKLDYHINTPNIKLFRCKITNRRNKLKDFYLDANDYYNYSKLLIYDTVDYKITNKMKKYGNAYIGSRFLRKLNKIEHEIWCRRWNFSIHAYNEIPYRIDCDNIICST